MITLALVTPGHVPALQPLLEHPGVAEMTPLPHPYPADGARDYVAGLIAAREAGTRCDWVILDGSGTPMGVVLIKDIDRTRQEGELGYWLGVPYWGQGHATAAARAAIALGFGELGLTSLVANTLPENGASVRVLTKLGFTPLREEPWVLPKWDAPRMGVVLRLLREQWAG